ncbi:ATP-binding protein [Cohaesibacter intestini]|uniref:ATP-binding protein n=1 Tax=Cohaesibacter intestini TaxID=2211145 RepID=UPI000DE9EDA1|nr:ATP-binding protein [Cohaesibacter intestini]
MEFTRPASLAMPYLTLTAHPTIGAVLLDSRPAWVWNGEGNRILWANAAGLAFFGEVSMDAMLNRSFGDVHPARRHLARLVRNARSNAPMLDRLRFFLGAEAITCNCLCKRLEVEGEGVLLVIATDYPALGNDDVERGQALLEALSAEQDIAAACLDDQLAPLAKSGAIDAILSDQDIIKGLASGANTPLRLVSKPLGEEEASPVTTLVRIGDAEHTRYLLVHYQGQSEADRRAEDHALLMAELGDSAEAESEQSAIDQGADVFASTFGMHDVARGMEHLKAELEKVDKARDSDLTPFHEDGSADKPVPPSPDPAIGSNIYTLPRAADRGAAKQKPDIEPSGGTGPERKAPPEADAQSLADALDKGGIYHFVWESDEVGRFSYVSKDLAKAVGPDNAAIIGKTWQELADGLEMDMEGTISRAFESRDTWVGLTVQWPVAGLATRVEVELTGLPIFGRYHGFKGFRGFGMCNTKLKRSDGRNEGPADAPLQSDTNRHQSDTTLPQFHDNREIMSEELLRAVNDAVAAAESLISPDVGSNKEALTPHSDPNGDRAMSDDQIETGGNEQNFAPSGLGASQIHASSGGDDTNTGGPASPSDDQASKGQGPDPYHRVRDLLTESAHGVKAFEPTKPQMPEPPAKDGQALSDGEKDAFDEIAAALGGSEFDHSLPEEEIDEDYEEFDDPIATMDDDTDDKAGDLPSMDRLTAKATDKIADNPDIDQARLQQALQTRSQGDATLKSAASSAFREIFAMDPAFRHMRERLAQAADKSKSPATAQTEQAREHQKLLEAVQALADGGDLHAAKAPEERPDSPEQIGVVAASQEPEAVAVGEDTEATEDVGAALADQPQDEALALDLPEATSAEQDLELAELELLDGVTDTVSIVEETEEPDSDTADTSAAPSQALAAATAAASMAGASLWDRADKTSPLIDLLNKLSVAMIVSADNRILFASRKALSLLGFDSASALEEAGGMEGLFSGRPGDWLTKTNGRTTLRGAGARPFSALATISSINWGDIPAALLSFEEAPDQPQAMGISEEDEKIAELEAILDTATDGVVVLDGDGHVLRMNHSAEALFEVDRHEVAGGSFLGLLAEESHKTAIDYLNSLSKNGLASVLNDGRDVIGVIASGGLIPLHVTMGRVNIPGTERFCAVLRDNSQHKRSEEELLTGKILAENANKQKSTFLAKVSHEIRTPLNAIIGFAEVMMEERFGPVGSERYKDYLRDIKTSGNHIMSLINDLLDLSKVEAGKMDLQFEATHLNRLVAETVSLMQQQANRQHIIIRTSLASELPQIAGDQRSLRQIVLNLLSNAVKFTHAGGQVILSTVHEENGDVVLRIRDTGIGMSEKDLVTALEPFRQVSSVRDSAQGTGLGLPLTKALVEANRGCLTLKSKPGEGTLVEVSFPAERVVEPQD